MKIPLQFNYVEHILYFLSETVDSFYYYNDTSNMSLVVLKQTCYEFIIIIKGSKLFVNETRCMRKSVKRSSKGKYECRWNTLSLSSLGQNLDFIYSEFLKSIEYQVRTLRR